MPVFNGEAFLREAIESLRGQRYRDFEIVIVNDGSTDRTESIARAFAERDGRVRLVTHSSNRGAPAARNTGLAHASAQSEFILNHDCDDISRPCMLERLVAALDADRRLGAAGCFCDYIDVNGRRMGAVRMEWFPLLILATFASLNSMVNSATLIRRAAMKVVGLYREDLDTCDDYDYWARMLMAGFALANVPEVLHYVRIHSASIGATRAEVMRRQAATVRAMYRGGKQGRLLGNTLGKLILRTLELRTNVRRLATRHKRNEHD
jgi:glycosyltransferase involved in cell wall biosynthesis